VCEGAPTCVTRARALRRQASASRTWPTPPAAHARSLRQARRRAPRAREGAPRGRAQAAALQGRPTAPVRLGRAGAAGAGERGGADAGQAAQPVPSLPVLMCHARCACAVWRGRPSSRGRSGRLGASCSALHLGGHGAQSRRSSGHQQRCGGVACTFRGAEPSALRQCAGCCTLGMQLRTRIARVYEAGEGNIGGQRSHVQ